MKKLNVLSMLSVLFLIFFASVSYGQATDGIGVVTAVEGTVNVTNSSGTEGVAEGSLVYIGDNFETGADSGIKIMLDDDSLISLGENTALEINEFIYTPDKRESISNITKGKIRAILKKIKGSDSNIEFVTPNAVAGIKGTTLYIHVENNLFAVKEGVVGVTSFEGTGQQVILQPNQFTRIVDGKLIAPSPMNKQMWLEYLDQTDIPEVASEAINLSKKEYPGDEGSDASLSMAELDTIGIYPAVPPIDLTSPVANVVPVTVIVNQ